MGTTTATIYLKPTTSAYLTINFPTEAVLYVPMRVLNGAYTSGIATSRSLRGLRSFLPSQSVPVVDERGLMTAPWYTFINFFVNTYLDFETGVTLADVKQQLLIDQALASANATTTAALSQLAVNNAQALSAVVQVTQSSALAGATSIPRVQLVLDELVSTGGPGGASE